MAVTTVTLLPRTTRSGVFTTPDIECPATFLTRSIKVRTDMEMDDLCDPGISCEMWIELSKDKGETWYRHFGMTWEGNNNKRKGKLSIENPAIGARGEIYILPYIGKRIRVWCNFPVPVPVGIILEYR